MSKSAKPATIVAAAHPELDPAYHGVAPPIWTSDAFEWASPDDKPAFDYARTVNPNRAMLVQTLAALEGAAGGVVTNSGQAAALLVLLRLPIGAQVLAPHDCYGGGDRPPPGFLTPGGGRCPLVRPTGGRAVG